MFVLEFDCVASFGQHAMAIELPQTVQEDVHVDTIDGDVGMNLAKARSLARKMFLFGFALLPWMWFVNVWYFWPQINGKDRILRTYVRRSAVGFVVFSAILLPWTATFLIGGKRLFGDDLWHRLSVSELVSPLAF
mmetsp:Transcript_7818/g.13438  ORF Transcript_7818/g.13438 Transcript_7818/m.13438 type:complete len:135 (-) Transcript_7818:501-905(-)